MRRKRTVDGLSISRASSFSDCCFLSDMCTLRGHARPARQSMNDRASCRWFHEHMSPCQWFDRIIRSPSLLETDSIVCWRSDGRVAWKCRTWQWRTKLQGRTVQDLTMTDQTVLLHCWTKCNQDYSYVSILKVFERYSLHKFSLLHLLTYADARGDNCLLVQ